MVNLEIWSEEMENENNEGVSTYKICNKLEDDIHAGMIPTSKIEPFSALSACGV